MRPGTWVRWWVVVVALVGERSEEQGGRVVRFSLPVALPPPGWATRQSPNGPTGVTIAQNSRAHWIARTPSNSSSPSE